MKKCLLLAAVLWVASGTLGLATIIHVPDDYPTIQEGVNAANPGDTVLVDPGIYYENVQLTEGVNLIGSGMDNTIIDGGGVADVVSALTINSCLIEGFTVQNSQQGGSTPGNVGVFLNPRSSAGTKTVRYCRVRHNGHGVQVWNDFGGVTYVEHNIICDNLYDGFDPYLGTTHLTNNSIVDNGRDGYHDWAGGGVVYIKNNIFAQNGRYGIFKHRDTPVYISYNDVWNNAQGASYEGYSGSPTPFDPYPGTGEIAADPIFVGPEVFDYYLRWHTPCLDAGDPSLPLDPDGTLPDMGALYFNQEVLGIVELCPQNAPIVIPPEGGDLFFDGWVFNFVGHPGKVDIWSYAFVPEMGRFGPISVYRNVRVPADSLGRNDLSEHVPGAAPGGDYVFVAYIGDYPGTIVDSSYFYFSKSGSVGGDFVGLGGGQGWLEKACSDVPNLPTGYALLENYPNPFNARTTISYQLVAEAHVNLEVYNTIGQRIATLVDARQEAGYGSVVWDASEISSGVYFYRLTAGDYTETKRMMLVK
jgi:hypothetical protein